MPDALNKVEGPEDGVSEEDVLKQLADKLPD
jgi:hypothetical protein